MTDKELTTKFKKVLEKMEKSKVDKNDDSEAYKIENKKLVKLPFCVTFERTEDHNFDFRISITENTQKYSVRDCLRLIVAKTTYESLMEEVP